MIFSGALTALATPMRDGHLDLKGLSALVEFQIAEGIDGLVPCGTTGEASTLSAEERAQVIRTVVQQTRHRVPVLAGAGANSTRSAIEGSRLAREAGADGVLQVTPYYNKPTQGGLVAHYRAVAEAAGLPVVAYNVPGRTGCDMLAETVAQVAAIPQVVGIKEATGSIARAQQIVQLCPSGFALLSGDDATALACVAVGGHGVISVLSNVVPRETAAMIRHARQSELEPARAILYKLLRLADLLFVEPNPIPVKAAIALMGYSANELRLPLVPLSGERLERLRAELATLGVIR